MPYYAHISFDGRKQTIKGHAYGTADKASTFAAPFHGERTAFAAGLLHDIGKYSEKAQKRIHGDNIKVDHSTAGAIECINHIYANGSYDYLPPAFAIAGHHAGLPDLGQPTNAKTDHTLMARYNRATDKSMVPDYSAYAQELSIPPVDPLPTQDYAELSIYIRMIFSCLVDADFLDTETFFDGQARQTRPADFQQLLQKLKHYTAQWQTPANPLNKRRQEILMNCYAKGRTMEQGLFTLTVPTGGGKTVASMAFALEHAVKHKFSRVIYVIPYTSIIDQTADTFRKILGGENILEHHSNKLYDPEESDESLLMAKATENWDMPVVITTAVQFFESLYACKTGRCRKLHNIANSVIIFDEAQMLPLEHLRPCVYAIDQLVKNYGCSAILCTATQPALDPIFKTFDPNRVITELCPTKLSHDRIFQRVQYKDIGVISPDKLTTMIAARKQALCVVNQRKTAQELYERLKDKPGTFHLSTYMYPEHRRQVIRKIKQRLYHNKPCRVISTSIIEAGIDLDFPAVFREETGLDSILQAGGRCNRNGKARPAQSVVTIFQLDQRPQSDLSRRITAYRHVKENYKRINTQLAITAYFKTWRDLSGERWQDNKQILALSAALKFREIGETFHMISDASHVIYIPANHKVEYLLALLENHKASVKIYRRLQNYIVPVYEQQYQNLLNMGLIRPLDDYTGILNDMSVYQSDIGLPYKIEQEPIII